MASQTAASHMSEYCGWKLEIFVAVLIPTCVCAVALRVYARRLVKMSFGLDDILVLLGGAAQISLAGISVGSVKHGGVGFHLQYLVETNSEKLETFFKYVIAFSTFYSATINLPKLAILVFYHRIFPTRSMRMATYLIGLVMILATLTATILFLAGCRPFSADWSLVNPGAGCIDRNALYLWVSAPSIVTDIAMLLLPLPVIWNLRANVRMKLGLTITFAIGSLGLMTSILRFYFYYKDNFDVNGFADESWYAVESFIWCEVETGVYLICSCLPSYRPLLEKMGIGKLTAGQQADLRRPSAGFLDWPSNGPSPNDSVSVMQKLQISSRKLFGQRRSTTIGSLEGGQNSTASSIAMVERPTHLEISSLKDQQIRVTTDFHVSGSRKDSAW